MFFHLSFVGCGVLFCGGGGGGGKGWLATPLPILQYNYIFVYVYVCEFVCTASIILLCINFV